MDWELVQGVYLHYFDSIVEEGLSNVISNNKISQTCHSHCYPFILKLIHDVAKLQFDMFIVEEIARVRRNNRSAILSANSVLALSKSLVYGCTGSLAGVLTSFRETFESNVFHMRAIVANKSGEC